MPADPGTATDLVAENARLPQLRNGAADSLSDWKDLQSKSSAASLSVKAEIRSQVEPGDYAVDVEWCARGGTCFGTKAVADAAGRVKFEPVLSIGAFSATIEQPQPREVRRRVQFHDGFGNVIAEYLVGLSYRSDSCTITPGSEAIDVTVVSLNGALFQDARDMDRPTIYKGTGQCGQPSRTLDWMRARATLELKTLFNPQVPLTSLSIIGVTTAITIRFDVSAAGEDRTQVVR